MSGTVVPAASEALCFSVPLLVGQSTSLSLPIGQKKHVCMFVYIPSLLDYESEDEKWV